MFHSQQNVKRTVYEHIKHVSWCYWKNCECNCSCVVQYCRLHPMSLQSVNLLPRTAVYDTLSLSGSGYDSCERQHYVTENYVVFVDGGAWFLLTPLKAPVNGWTVLCLPCGGPQFEFPLELAPHYLTSSISPSSDSSTSTSSNWCCIHQNQCPQKTCNFGNSTFLFIATSGTDTFNYL